MQRDALQQAGCAKIYEDHTSGVKAVRPGLEQALEVARTGDVLVVWRLDRLGRSLKDLIEMVETLSERGIELHSLQEAITTTTSSGQLIFHLFGALAEFERNLIRERTQARSKGKVERPFRTVKEAHETLYHFHEPETEAEANRWLHQYLLNYNSQPHGGIDSSRSD